MEADPPERSARFARPCCVRARQRCVRSLQPKRRHSQSFRRHHSDTIHNIQDEYVDHSVSGAKDRRPTLDALMEAARQKKLDVALVVKFDRFARSTRHLLNALDEFRSLGIDFCSLSDAVDTTTPYGKVLFTTIIGALAELERELIRQWVANGARRAQERGKPVGRPRARFDLTQARSLHEEGASFRAIGRLFGVSRVTVARTLAQNPPIFLPHLG